MDENRARRFNFYLEDAFYELVIMYHVLQSELGISVAILIRLEDGPCDDLKK